MANVDVIEIREIDGVKVRYNKTLGGVEMEPEAVAVQPVAQPAPAPAMMPISPPVPIAPEVNPHG